MIILALKCLVFPGFVFCVLGALLVSWVDRKVTARVQWRVGPPLLQPLYDFLKLLGKEVIVPKRANQPVFLSAPLISLASATVVSTMLWLAVVRPGSGFVFDIIVIIYLLMIPSIALIIGAAASANPLASLGASREMKMMLGYELPFILSIVACIIKTGTFAFKLTKIISAQSDTGYFLYSWSGLIAFAVALICIQAKLGIVPFDAPEAETEISGGVMIEYSGPALALMKLSRQMLLFSVPLLIVELFMGGINSIYGILKYLAVLFIIILIRNTNPRLRIDQAQKFFWGPVTAAAIIAVLLAVWGY